MSMSMSITIPILTSILILLERFIEREEVLDRLERRTNNVFRIEVDKYIHIAIDMDMVTSLDPMSKLILY
jgi:hypothetical protein